MYIWYHFLVSVLHLLIVVLTAEKWNFHKGLHYEVCKNILWSQTYLRISCNCTLVPYFYVNCYLVNHMKIYQEVLHTVVSPLFHNDCPNLFLKLDTHAILVLPLPICCLNLTTGIPPPKSSPNNKGSYLYLELEKKVKKYF